MNMPHWEFSSLQLAGFDLPLSLAVIAGGAVLYTLYLTLSPLLEEGEISSEEWSRMEDESIALLNKRDRVIAELKELEFEAAMNKIDDADLSRLKGQYEREALKLIKALDEQASTYVEEIDSEILATREAARARKAQASSAAKSNLTGEAEGDDDAAIEAKSDSKSETANKEVSEVTSERADD